MAQVKFLQYEKEETGKGLSDLDDIDNNMALIEPLFYHAIATGYKVNKQEMKYTREQVVLILDECLFDFMEGMGDFFQKGVKPKK